MLAEFPEGCSVEVADDWIRVEHGGVERMFVPGDEVVFGRGSGATIRIGVADPHVHRRAGSFRWAGGRWELHNDGEIATLEVHLVGGLEARVFVGSHPFVLPWGAHGTVRTLTPVPYALSFDTFGASPGDGRQSATASESGDGLDCQGGSGLNETTSPRSRLGLLPSEVKMLVALCEPRLRDPRLPAFTIPTTKDVCARLGITPKRAEDLVDGLVRKLAPYVDGVIGTNDGRAVNRRHRIAAFAIDTRCVTVRDLRLLEEVGDMDRRDRSRRRTGGSVVD